MKLLLRRDNMRSRDVRGEVWSSVTARARMAGHHWPAPGNIYGWLGLRLYLGVR